jgi:hypothetical protein
VVGQVGGQIGVTSGVRGVGEGSDDDGFGLARVYTAWLMWGRIVLVRERVVFVVTEGVSTVHGRSGATAAPGAAAAPNRARTFVQTWHVYVSAWVGVMVVREVLEEGTELGGTEGMEVIEGEVESFVAELEEGVNAGGEGA